MSSASHTQGYDAVFTCEVPDDLTCVICHLVLRDPVQVINCGHCYCSVCLDQLVEHSNRSSTPLLCPVDREVIEPNKVFKDKRTLRTVRNLNVKCSANELGCDWSGCLGDLQAHVFNCDYVAKQNSFQDKKYTDQNFKELFHRMNNIEDNLISKDKEIASLKFMIKEMKENHDGVVKQLRDSIACLKDEFVAMKEKYEDSARKNIILETETKDLENRLTEAINKNKCDIATLKMKAENVILCDPNPILLNQSQSSVSPVSKPKVEPDTKSKVVTPVSKPKVEPDTKSKVVTPVSKPKVEPDNKNKFVTTTNPIVFFDITADGESLGRMEMTLRADVVPKTAENFRALCTGEKGFGYKGSKFHLVVSGCWCKGGDITKHNGSGGKSIYGETFAQENFLLKHTGPGVLSMVKRGGNTNGSQFMLWTVKSPGCDGRCVVFGNVTKGMEVVKNIESLGNARSGKTSKEVVISDCGQIN